jgi:xanthine dehydrogenase YagS FAD-binding subunit
MRSFSYVRARDAASALTAADSKPGSRFIGGGTNLIDFIEAECRDSRHCDRHQSPSG